MPWRSGGNRGRLVGQLHVVPEFLGNRAPFADPDAKGDHRRRGHGRRASTASSVSISPGCADWDGGARQIIEAQRSSPA